MGCGAPPPPGAAARAGRRFAQTAVKTAQDVDFDMVDSGSADPWRSIGCMRGVSVRVCERMRGRRHTPDGAGGATAASQRASS